MIILLFVKYAVQYSVQGRALPIVPRYYLADIVALFSLPISHDSRQKTRNSPTSDG